MRTRSRTKQENVEGKWVRMRKYRTNCSNPSSLVNVLAESFATAQPYMSTKQTSTITDQLTAKYSRFRERKPSPKQIEEMKSVGILDRKYKSFRPVNPCTHTSSTIRWIGENATLHVGTGCAAEQPLYTTTYPNGAILYQAITSQSGDLGLHAINRSTLGAVSPFIKPDWFALMSKFDEACDSIIPSSMLVGEPIVECSIFVSAFKILLNPSSSLRYLFNFVRSSGLEKKTLGTIAKYARNSSNAYLSYQFGVKPAIDDVREALRAHEIVQRRLNYLSFNSGSYVPIRVRQELISDYTVPSWPTYPLVSSTTTRKVYADRRALAVIGAWGRVREDLNWKDTWNAYQQYFGIAKVVGLAWELIPFSFVLDWFTNAQERLNNLTRPRTGGAFTEFVGLHASLKQSTAEEIYCLPGYAFNIGASMVKPTAHFKLCDIHKVSYERYNHIPDTSGVVDFSSLGLFQLLASGALIVQRALR